MNKLHRKFLPLLALLWACSRPQPAPALAADAAIAGSDATIGDAACAYPPCGEPDVHVAPAQVIFAVTTAGSKATALVTLSNTGTGAWPLAGIELEADPAFLMECGNQTVLAGQPATLAPPWSLAPGHVVTCKVTFSPQDAKPHAAQLRFLPVDPAQAPVLVPIVAPQPQPCLAAQPAEVDFGTVVLGQSKVIAVKLTNCGPKTVELTGGQVLPASAVLAVSAVAGQLPCKDFPTAPCPLAPAESLTLDITYTPVASTQPDNAVLTVAWDGGPPLLVPLSGANPQVVCPKAIITLTGGTEVVPQTQLYLSGEKSHDRYGAPVKKYAWTVEQPPGSNAMLLPNASAAKVKLAANAAGAYKVCLDVWDTAGVKSCLPACITFVAVADNAVHIELLWDTPTDPDQSDTGPAAGADMDLHFGHELASNPDLDCDGVGDPWFDNPHDCFWFNPNPNWGSNSPAADDDPSQDLEDTDGAGPENLNLVSPEGTLADPSRYSVGVHYWNDHGLGESFATVTVFLQGVVALKIDKVKMQPLDMWYVGKINWPNNKNGAPNVAPVTVCYQTGEACLAPTDPAAGKMWQPQSAPKSDWCITKCYINEEFLAAAGGASAPTNCKKK